MKRNLYVRQFVVLMVVMLVFTGCSRIGSYSETDTPTEQTTLTEATFPTIEGVPSETVEAFYLMHQRMEEGTLRMRIYATEPLLLPAKGIPIDSLLGKDLSGSNYDLDVIVVENEQLQEHRDLVFALQPQMLIRIPDLVEGSDFYPVGGTCLYEDIEWAYIFETEEDGVILKIGLNVGTCDVWFSDDFGCDYCWSVNNCFYYRNAAFYEVIRPFLSEEQREMWDRADFG